MSTLGTIMNVAGMPGADMAVTAALNLTQTVQHVKIYRNQCRELASRCTKLVMACREKSRGLEGTELVAEMDQVQSVIEKANQKATEWAQWGRVKSFANQGDIQQGLDSLYKELEYCAQQFNLAASAEIHLNQLEAQKVYASDVAEDRETLRAILTNVDKLREIMGDPKSQERIMSTIQMELSTLRQDPMQPDSEVMQTMNDLQQGLSMIQGEAKVSPLMIDLTGTISNVSEKPIKYGAYNLVYKGVWQDEEDVALKLARGFNQSEKAQRRFMREVEVWRNLQHRNVCRLYGIFYVKNQIYSVSPWMRRGNARDYIKSTEEIVDRLAILRDVASGLDYLHGQQITHGDLRAANVLIDDDKRACVSGFGLAKAIEEAETGEYEDDDAPANTGETSVRWQAPELIFADEDEKALFFTHQSDVWSYGMLCIEILSGKRPFHNLASDARVILFLDQRGLPERPRDEDTISRGLGNEMWSLIQECWEWLPGARPSMMMVKARLKKVPPATNIEPATPASTILGDPMRVTNSPNSPSRDIPSSSREPSWTTSATLNVPTSTSYSIPVSDYTGSPMVLSSTPPRITGSPSTPPRSAGTLPFSTQSAMRPSASAQRNKPLPLSQVFATSSQPTTGHTLPETSRSRAPSDSSSLSYGRPRATWTGSQSDSAVRSGASLDLVPVRNTLIPERQYSAESVFDGSRSSESLRQASLPQLPPTTRSDDSGPVLSIAGALAQVNDYNDYDVDSGPLIDLNPRVVFQPSPSLSNGLGLDVYTLTPASPYSPNPTPPPSRAERSVSSASASSSRPSYRGSLLAEERNRSSSFSDAPPPIRKNSLLDTTDLDLTEHIKFSSDGSVKYGTLSSLVRQLLRDNSDTKDYAKDRDFRETFLVTHRLFTKSEKVLRLLVYFFKNTNSIPMEERTSMRMNVISVLTQWLRGHYAQALSVEALEDLRSFLQDVTTPEVITRTIGDLVSTINALLRAKSTGHSIAPSRSGSSISIRVSSREIQPSDLALALFIYEGDRYKLITPTDFVSNLNFNPAKTVTTADDRVKDASDVNNRITAWVKNYILKAKTVAERKNALSFFVRTAFECRQLNNFSSLSAIWTACDSQDIQKLVLTRQVLDEKEYKRNWKTVSDLMDVKNHHTAYKSVLPDYKKKDATKQCIPMLAAHLNETQYIKNNAPSFKNEERTIIDFQKFIRIHKNITEALAYQRNEDEASKRVIEDLRAKCEKPLVYLEDKLSRLKMDVREGDVMKQLARDLQEREEYDHKHRVLEIEAAGFRAKKRK